VQGEIRLLPYLTLFFDITLFGMLKVIQPEEEHCPHLYSQRIRLPFLLYLAKLVLDNEGDALL
jgi:hypothetical protein